MKNMNILIVFLSLLYCGCQERDSNTVGGIGRQNNYYEDSTLGVAMKKFGLPYDEQRYKSDSSSLVFYCLRTFDSSFLIQFRQEQNEIRGAYFIEMPSYYNVDDYGARENHLLFFEGYSFVIDSAKWQSIRSQAEELLRDTSFKKSPGCRGCKEYGLSYGFNNKVDNGTRYEAYYGFLKELFLNDLTQRQKLVLDKQ